MLKLFFQHLTHPHTHKQSLFLFLTHQILIKVRNKTKNMRMGLKFSDIWRVIGFRRFQIYLATLKKKKLKSLFLLLFLASYNPLRLMFEIFEFIGILQLKSFEFSFSKNIDSKEYEIFFLHPRIDKTRKFLFVVSCSFSSFIFNFILEAYKIDEFLFSLSQQMQIHTTYG